MRNGQQFWLKSSDSQNIIHIPSCYKQHCYHSIALMVLNIYHTFFTTCFRDILRTILPSCERPGTKLSRSNTWDTRRITTAIWALFWLHVGRSSSNSCVIILPRSTSNALKQAMSLFSDFRLLFFQLGKVGALMHESFCRIWMHAVSLYCAIKNTFGLLGISSCTEPWAWCT